MIEPLTIVNTGTMAAKINELVDFANSRVNEPMGATGVGYNPINPAEPTEKIEQLTAEDLTRDNVVRYLNQHATLSSVNPIDRAYVQRAIDILMGKVEKLYTLDEVAEMMGRTNVYPCYALRDRCQLSGHGCKPTIAECWKYTIEQGWLKGE